MSLFGISTYTKQQGIRTASGPKRDPQNSYNAAGRIQTKAAAATQPEKTNTGPRHASAYQVSISPAAMKKWADTVQYQQAI
ncbi:hypothetical protein ACQZV8_19490 [Magnetococcales bacterium HHB-1]